MPTQDDVNRQHFAMAGIDPESIGKPIEETPERRVARSVDEQCPSVHEGEHNAFRCMLVAGHANYHRQQGTVWTDRG
jgi:hypothetical protein